MLLKGRTPLFSHIIPTLEVTQGQILKVHPHNCHPILVAFVWESTRETINLPLGCLQGGMGYSGFCCDVSPYNQHGLSWSFPWPCYTDVYTLRPLRHIQALISL